MKRFVILLLSIIVFASCTRASMEARRIKSDINQLLSEGRACANVANSHRDVQILKEKMPIEEGDTPSLMMLNDKTFATDTEIEAILKLNALRSPCKSLVLEKVQNIVPELALVTARYSARSDELTLDIINREISWGEANRRKRDLRISFKEKVQRIGRDLENRLYRVHYNELSQRQSVVRAMQNYQYQQQLLSQQNQLLNAIKRPTFTNCNFFGNSIRCTTN